MKSKNIISNSTLVIITLIAVFLALELCIRIFLPSQRRPAMYAKMPDGNYCLKPNLNMAYNQKEFSFRVITNSAGLRNKAQLINKDVILFVGDSFTFGSGVDEEAHYSHVFDTLANWGNKRFNIYNAGVPGYSTINEYMRIKAMIGEKLAIKKIFLGIDISDFNENLLFPIYDVEDARLVFSKKGNGGLFVKALNSLARNSELVNIVYYRLVHSSILKNYFSSALKLDYFKINLPDKNLGLFALKKSAEADKKIDKFSREFSGIAALCKENNIDLYVYYIPTLQEVYAKFYEKTLKEYNLSKSDYELSFLNNFVKGLCANNGVKFLDIKADIMKFNVAKMYYYTDQHFNNYGNLVAGISLYERFTNDKK